MSRVYHAQNVRICSTKAARTMPREGVEPYIGDKEEQQAPDLARQEKAKRLLLMNSRGQPGKVCRRSHNNLIFVDFRGAVRAGAKHDLDDATIMRMTMYGDAMFYERMLPHAGSFNRARATDRPAAPEQETRRETQHNGPGCAKCHSEEHNGISSTVHMYFLTTFPRYSTS